MGVGIPGFPNMLLGRTNYLSYGLTYGTMDQHDHFVEEVIDGYAKRPNNERK
jgi:acyl-homoserine lactone acylase PvdQ